MRGRDVRQLSLLIKPDTRMGDLADGVIMGELSLSGTLAVYSDLNRGEDLIVTVSNSAGTVIAGGQYVVEGVSTSSIKIQGLVVGQKRAHSTSLTNGELVKPDDADPRGGA